MHFWKFNVIFSEQTFWRDYKNFLNFSTFNRLYQNQVLRLTIFSIHMLEMQFHSPAPHTVEVLVLNKNRGDGAAELSCKEKRNVPLRSKLAVSVIKDLHFFYKSPPVDVLSLKSILNMAQSLNMAKSMIPLPILVLFLPVFDTHSN